MANMTTIPSSLRPLGTRAGPPPPAAPVAGSGKGAVSPDYTTAFNNLGKGLPLQPVTEPGGAVGYSQPAPATPPVTPRQAAYDNTVVREPDYYELREHRKSDLDTAYHRDRADQLADRQAALAEQEALFARLPSMMALVGGTPGGTAPGSPAPLPGTPSASDLAFGRAKDKVGLIAKSKMQAAQSSGDPRVASSVIEGAGDDLSDFATTQAMQEAQRAGQVEDRNVAHSLNVRQQNMSMLPSLLALLRRSY